MTNRSPHLVYSGQTKVMMKPTCKLIFYSSHKADWGSLARLNALREILRHYDDIKLAPDRVGSSEARTFGTDSLSVAEIEAIWQKGWGATFKRNKPWSFLLVLMFYPAGRSLNRIWAYLDAEFFKDEQRVERLLDLAKSLYRWGFIDHGYVTLTAEYEKKNNLSNSDRQLGPVGGPNLHVSLPGVYWANFFGPSYVQWLGERKFESLNTYHKEKLFDGGWQLVTRPSVLHYDGAMRAHERNIVKHLGRCAFFEIEDAWNPLKKLVAPDFLNSE